MKNIFMKIWPGKSEKSQNANLLFEIEQPFNDLYQSGLVLSETPDRGVKRRARFYNLANFLNYTSSLEGAVIECGCWKGLSSYLMCNYLRQYAKEFKGENFYIFDSFEGLSEPTEVDKIQIDLIDQVGNRQNTFFKQAGAYDASLEHVKKVLEEFPQIHYHKGWLPEALIGISIPSIKFLHIDLDLYEPIIGCLEKLYPYVVNGGVIVCDDYGSLYWPGAKKAVEEFAIKKNIKFVSLSSGQAVFIKT